MIAHHQKFRIPDTSNKTKGIDVEVNWKDDPAINRCQVLRFTLPDKQEMFVERKDLYEILFAIGEPAEQQKMVPQKITRTREYKTRLGIKATKDIRKGEDIVVPVEFRLPDLEDEVYGDIKRTAVRNLGITGFALPAKSL